MRAVIYSRVSTTDKGQDTENQARQMRDYCRVQGWTLVEEFEDHMSGSRKDRPQLKTVFQMASQHKFDVLLFWSLDRLTREGIIPTLHYLQQLNDYGIQYKSFTEQYIDTCGFMGEVLVALLAALAKQERIRISERTKAGMAARIAAGKAGPTGQIGPGRPAKTLDLVELRRRRDVEDQSFQTIADALGFSKTWIIKQYRLAQKRSGNPSVTLSQPLKTKSKSQK